MAAYRVPWHVAFGGNAFVNLTTGEGVAPAVERVVPWTGAKALFAALILDAADIIERRRQTAEARCPTAWREARAWVRGMDRGLISLRDCCEGLGLDAPLVQAALLHRRRTRRARWLNRSSR